MSVVLTIMSVFLLYIHRFKKDFDEEQTTIFITACIVLFVLCCILLWLMNKA